MKRPLRSVLIGDCDYYPSELIYGFQQGMSLLGHTHRSVNIRWDIGVIRQVLNEVRPDLIVGHMLLWAPGGPAKTLDLLGTCEEWRTRGTRVVLHDGDAREEARFPNDISRSVDLALCNHTCDRSIWRVKAIRWPYFAFYQDTIADPSPEWACDLFFAGRLGAGLYQQRSEMLECLVRRFPGVFKLVVDRSQHTLFQTPEIAASAGAVLGYGRPNAAGWLDVRVLQYPGAGGVLLHDQADEYLTPYKHYIPYESGNVDSILAAAQDAQERGDAIRWEAFDYVQREHSSVPRVRQVLSEVGLA